MFVRTKKGKIFDCNVAELMGKPIYYPKTSKTNGCIDYSEVHKKSENIIDILEEGDYVNGILIEEIGKNPDYKTIWHYSTYGDDDICFTNAEIESVVTKEQFESMSYKVGE